MNTILCPHCGKDIEISQALTKQIESEVIGKEKEKHALELEEAKKAAALESNKKITEQFEYQLKLLKEDKDAANERNKALIEDLGKLTQELRNTRKEQEELSLKMQQKI